MSSTTTLLEDERLDARRDRPEPEGRTPGKGIRGRPRVPKTGGSFLFEPVVETIFTRELFSEEQQQIDEMVRQLAKEKILPRKAELEHHNQELTMELLREVAELGLTGIDVPEKYGGVELDKTTSALVVEALTTGGSASWVVTFSCHVGIGSLPIVYFGNDAQKAKYLPKLASAEWLGAYALTEPQAGLRRPGRSRPRRSSPTTAPSSSTAPSSTSPTAAGPTSTSSSPSSRAR